MKDMLPVGAFALVMKRSRKLIPYAIWAGLLVAALGAGIGSWCFNRRLEGGTQADLSSEKDEVLYRRMLQALAYVVPEGEHTGGCGVLVDQQERLVVTVSRLVGEKTTARVSFACAGDGGRPKPAQAATAGKVAFRDTTRGLVLLRLQELPSGTAALPLGDWTPSTTVVLHSVRRSEMRGLSAEACAWSSSQGRIERVLMIPHY